MHEIIINDVHIETDHDESSDMVPLKKKSILGQMDNEKHIELVTIIPSAEEDNGTDDGMSNAVKDDYFANKNGAKDILLRCSESSTKDFSGEPTDIDDHPNEPNHSETPTRRPPSRCCFSWNVIVCPFTFHAKERRTDDSEYNTD